MDEEVLERIKKIEERLDNLERIMKNVEAFPTRESQKLSLKSINMKDLLALPTSLQKTMLTIQELEEATATRVAEETGRDRTVETIYLNQLMRLGFLTRERRGRKVYFKVLRYY